MLKLRRFLCGWFGYFALVNLFISFGTLPKILSFSREMGIGPTLSSLSPGEKILATVISIFACLIFAIPLVVAFLNGMAWWTIKQGKTSGRGWAIAASLSLILSSIPIALPIRNMWKYFPVGISVTLLVLCGAMVVLGILGVVAFGRRDAMAQPVIAAKPPRIAGDGTSRLLDGAAWMFVVLGYFECMHLWGLWSRAHGLTMSDGFFPLLLFLIGILITIAFHEFGHASMGLALGMKLHAFIVGPFQWRIMDGRWKFQFLPTKFFSAGGATSLVPTNPQQSRWREICMTAAGPLMNLLTGLIALVVALTAKGKPYEHVWELLAIVATLSLLAFARNLIPSQLNIQHAADYSDGAQIYQILRGGPWADMHRVFTIAASTLATPLRPSDFDIEAIQRASSLFTHGRRALLLRLFAFYYFLDCGKIREASEAVAEAELVCKESVSEIPAELHTDFVFGNALLRRDAASARQWWERMEAKKPTHFGVDYWLAKSALVWIEGRKEDAREAWNKGNVLAQKLPTVGIYEFDRYRCALLHDCIEKEEINAAS